MFDATQRAQLRAALRLWLAYAKAAKQHPSEIPAVKGEFMVEHLDPMSTVQIEALILCLESEVIYTTVTLAAAKYGCSKNTLKRELDALDYKPVPGSKVYSMSDVIIALNTLNERKRRGFFG